MPPQPETVTLAAESRLDPEIEHLRLQWFLEENDHRRPYDLAKYAGQTRRCFTEYQACSSVMPSSRS
jgi:hypothetical protein